jgi:uncharacterized UPF0160 family protein
MPTGYTAKVLQGCSFQEFVWSCIRAFIEEARESDGPIPLVYEQTERIALAEAEIASCQAEIDRVATLSDEEILVLLAKRRADRQRQHRAYQEASARENDQLQTMLVQVQQWSPPATILGLKSFMIQQIEITMNHPYPWDETVGSDAQEIERYRREAASRLQSAREHLETIRRADAHRNEIVAALAASVPPPEDTSWRRGDT